MWTDEQIKKLLSMWPDNRTSYFDMMKSLGKSRSSIYCKAQRLGLGQKPPKKEISTEDMNKIFDLITEVSERNEVSMNYTITRIRNEWNGKVEVKI